MKGIKIAYYCEEIKTLVLDSLERKPDPLLLHVKLEAWQLSHGVDCDAL